MEILGNDDEVDEAAWTPPGRSTPVTAGPAGYVRDTGDDRTGIPRRPAPPRPGATELDLGEQGPDLGRADADPRHAGGPSTGGSVLPPAAWPDGRPGSDGAAPDPRPGLQDPVTEPARVPAPEPEPVGIRDLLLSTVLSAEALGLSGLVLAFGAVSSTVPTVLAFSNPGNDTADQLQQYGLVYGLTGLVVLVLGAVAIYRLRPTGGSAAGRALAGAAAVVGVLLMLLAAYIVVLAGDFPADPVEDFS